MRDPVSVEEGRKILGDLAREAYFTGAETVLTFYGRRLARIVPLEDTMNPTTAHDEDVHAQATHILRNTGITRVDGKTLPLTEAEAKRAVDALARAGLLRDQPATPSEPRDRLTSDMADAILQRRLNESPHSITIVESGAVRLEWRDDEFVVRSHQGEHYRGRDRAAAVEAYNTATTQD